MRFKGEFSTSFSFFALASLLGAIFLWPRGLPASPDFRFDRLSLEHGLSQSSVFSLAGDRYGFLWIATEQGLDRFDGFGVETLRYAPGQARSLTHSGVRAVLTDPNGSLWAGTWNGLNRIDPTDLSVRQISVPSPFDQQPFGVQPDGLGRVCENRLLVLTRESLWWLNLDDEDETLKPLIAMETDPALLPQSWQAIDGQTAWLANARTLWRLHCDSMQLVRVERFNDVNELEPERGRSRLAFLPDGRLLWASEDGLRLVDPASDSSHSVPVESPDPWRDQAPLAIHVDDQSRPWALLPNALVAIEVNNPGRWTAAAEWSQAVPADIRHRLESAHSGDGLTWLGGTFGVGVVDGPGLRVRLLEHDSARPDSLPPTLGRVGYRIVADRFGVLWIGANLGGLARYVPEQHRFGQVPLTLRGASRVVRGVTEVSDGSQSWLWVGYDDAGIEVLALDASGRFASTTTFRAHGGSPEALPSNRIVAMAREPGTQRVWILGNDWLAWHAPNPAGAAFNIVATPPDFSESSTRALSFSRDRRYLLITTSRELWRLPLDQASGPLQAVEFDFSSQPDADFYPVIQLADGTIVIGCRQGLHLLDPDSGQRRTLSLGMDQPGSPARFAFSLAEAANGDLWLGTHGGGLVRIAAEHLALDDPPLQRWTTEQRLADNTVYAILEDGAGCLWISGNRGLSQLCPDWDRPRNFSLHDGLQAYEFNGRVADIGPSGRFYFGGINGVNSFWPERIVDHPQPPAIRMTGLAIEGQPVEHGTWAQPLRLRHDQNELTIDYLGLHSMAPNRVRYAHRLLGLESDWVEVGAARRARYPALPPGDYRFELRAANPDGVWSEPQVLFEASIRPPPWHTGPAYLGYILIMLAGFGFIAWSVRQRRLHLEALVSQRTRELAERSETVSRQAAALEDLLASRQTLYANVSHELRTPLTLIRAGLDRLKRNPGDAEALELGERYIHRLDRLVDQLLDLSTVRADAFTPEAEPWPLDPWLRQIARDHQAVAEDRQLQLDLVIQGQWQTHCNRELLDKCLSNLLSNALKYTPAGGQLVLRLGGTAERAEIEVADTGPGIPPEQQATIFERFQRLPAQETQAEKGAGIGLALVHEAAVALGGEIRLHSQPGQGSRFILAIPARQISESVENTETDRDATAIQPEPAEPTQETSQSPATTDPARPAARLGTLLIVEDNRDLRRHLKGLLSDQWKIITASDGHQALARLAVHDIDIILSDIMMPTMDGLELLKRIRNDLTTSHIPFLILTARRDADTRLQGLKLAADAVLAKPFSDQELPLRLANTARAIEQRRRQEGSGNGDEPAISARDQAFIDQINTWLEAHYRDSATRINDLAQHLDLDERSLQRKTRALFGQSPRALLIEYRLERSIPLLRDTDRTVAAIAEECGFSSASYFSRQFSKRFGQTPAAWKKRNFRRDC